MMKLDPAIAKIERDSKKLWRKMQADFSEKEQKGELLSDRAVIIDEDHARLELVEHGISRSLYRINSSLERHLDIQIPSVKEAYLS
jgi:hypothetical protein